MNDTVVVIYNGEPVSVPKEVADFLEQDRKREQAQAKQDQRHLSKSEFETVLSGLGYVRRPVEDAALRNLQLEILRKAVDELDDQSRDLICLRYDSGLTMEEIGRIYGVSKVAVSKRLKKLCEKLRSSVIGQGPSTFFFFWFTNLPQVSLSMRGKVFGSRKPSWIATGRIIHNGTIKPVVNNL